MTQAYDKVNLGKKARELGFVRDAFEKMIRLTAVLQFIGSEPELSALLALKGGTAINLILFSLPRLSVDIDLDFAENLTKEETATARKRVNELLGRHMTGSGYALSEKSKHTHALDSFVYAYTNAAGNTDNIKIEINYILRSHVLPTVTATARTGGAFPEFSIRTLAPVEIFASKIIALTGRGAARDLYDLNSAIYYGLFAENEYPLLRKCTVFYLAVAGEASARGFQFEKLNGITAQTIRKDISPMRRGTEKFDFASAKERVLRFLSELLTLSHKEVTFLQRFASGHYEPELLFEDVETLQRVGNHPMAAWRIQHIRQERQRDGEIF
jgi:predicted nucleotidyltransferase component of viral defense system